MIIVHEFKSVIEDFMTQYDGLEAKMLADIIAFSKEQRVKAMPESESCLLFLSCLRHLLCLPNSLSSNLRPTQDVDIPQRMQTRTILSGP
jgi:hypothetical protein